MRKLCLELGVSEAYLFGDDETDDIGSMLPMLTAEQRSQVRGYIEGILSRSGDPSQRVGSESSARRTSRKPFQAKRSPEQPK